MDEPFSHEWPLRVPRVALAAEPSLGVLLGCCRGSQQHVMGKQTIKQIIANYASLFWGRKWQHQWHHANMDDRWARCMIMPFYKLNKNLCGFQQNRKQTTQTDRSNNKSDNPKNNSKSNVTNNTTTAAKNKKINQPGYRSLFVSHLAFCSRLQMPSPMRFHSVYKLHNVLFQKKSGMSTVPHNLFVWTPGNLWKP